MDGALTSLPKRGVGSFQVLLYLTTKERSCHVHSNLMPLYFTEGYYKESSAHCELYHAPGDHDGAIQSAVCHRNLTSKPLATPLCVIVCPIFAST